MVPYRQCSIREYRHFAVTDARPSSALDAARRTHLTHPHDRETSVSASGGMIVHVVDDDDGVRTGFTRLLRSAGIDVRAYPSADRFLDEVDSVPPGCVLLDITMPGISGPETLQRLKDKRNLLPVIVVSARDN